MKLLLDTCTFLWMAAGDRRLSQAALDACTDPANEAALSAISAWEISVKWRLGRLPLPEPPHRWIPSRRQQMKLTPLDFDEASAVHTHHLTDHHRDPFDRALVAVAVVHGLTIVTPDPLIEAYPAPTLW